MSSELVARAVLHRIADAQPEITLEDGAAAVTESVAIRAMEDFAERAFSDVETLRARIEALETENAQLREDRNRYERQICAAEHGHTVNDVLANYRQIRRAIQDRRAREGGNADGS